MLADKSLKNQVIEQSKPLSDVNGRIPNFDVFSLRPCHLGYLLLERDIVLGCRWCQYDLLELFGQGQLGIKVASIFGSSIRRPLKEVNVHSVKMSRGTEPIRLENCGTPETRAWGSKRMV
ncbi:MAG: hypothetical protein DRQ10_03780 [Candidatus Hydrothermota bacterium]|nr:MAG: hypothetical protein DRQ10_03780 [Candidatus Hydrothermae bacterium]